MFVNSLQILAFNDSSNRNQHEKKIHGVAFNAKNNNVDDIKAEQFQVSQKKLFNLLDIKREKSN